MSEEVIPVYVPEEWVGLRERILVWMSSTWIDSWFHRDLRYRPELPQHLLDRPQVAVRHFSWAAFPPQKTINQADILSHRFSLIHQNPGGCCGLPFSKGPWLLVWGTGEGRVCISGFCRWSSSGFRRWTEATVKTERGSPDKKKTKTEQTLH